MDALEITHVVSMSGSPPSWPEDIEYHVQCIPHEDDCLFLKCLSSACDFVRQALALGGNVLVHCVRGVNLSAATVVGYLMLDEQLSFEQVTLAFALLTFGVSPPFWPRPFAEASTPPPEQGQSMAKSKIRGPAWSPVQMLPKPGSPAALPPPHDPNSGH